MIKMKLHITAVLTISALALASCGTQKVVMETTAPIDEKKVLNEAQSWATNSKEARFIYYQNLKSAENKILRLMNEGRSERRAVFIDPTFLLFDQNKTYEYLTSFENLDGQFNVGELRGYCKNQYSTQAVELLRLCNEAGMEVILMIPEQDAMEIMNDLLKMNIQAIGSIMHTEPKPGRFAKNITLREYAATDRVGLILTTSLGEVSDFTMSRGQKGIDDSSVFESFGEKIILFPNPAFN
jgi:predicted secreted acid phosphatase